MDYEQDTLNAYRTTERAIKYKEYHTTGWSWGRFVTWIEQRKIRRILASFEWSATDKILDIPCGTGILGAILHEFPFKIVASDISLEMMELAKTEYPPDQLLQCLQTDITDTGFPSDSFTCIVSLGFLHRVPKDIKRAALHEIFSLTNRIAIVSCSVSTPLQKLKHRVLSWILRKHVPAPCPVPLNGIISECESQGFQVLKTIMVVPLFSAHAILVLKK